MYRSLSCSTHALPCLRLVPSHVVCNINSVFHMVSLHFTSKAHEHCASGTVLLLTDLLSCNESAQTELCLQRCSTVLEPHTWCLPEITSEQMSVTFTVILIICTYALLSYQAQVRRKSTPSRQACSEHHVTIMTPIQSALGIRKCPVLYSSVTFTGPTPVHWGTGQGALDSSRGPLVSL